ncbi:MAG TPA: amidohydrolase family protein [Thermoanaerobaculia bacterium]|jgi:aminocarboxymuconate-semialdehyde decarboxylase|nr:amidohydrolase family protein [Thermoanaerobaculia bacterium]
MPIVDFHNHYYPPEYLDALGPSGSTLSLSTDREGNPVVHYPGDYNVMVRGHRDIAYRQSVLDEQGVDTQIISLTTPGTHVEVPAVAVTLARITNDAFARVHAERPRRFVPLATLPLCDPQAAAAELERAMDQLKMPGAMLFSNVNGVGLDDERFRPLYEVADERDAVLMIHPTSPVGVEAMSEYWLMPLNGFLFDTTLAASKLVFSGTVRRFPRIRWVLGHLGGTIPYLAERLDRGYRAFEDCRVHIDRPPTEYLKKHFYYDTVNFDPNALRLAIEFAGADHILAGSDYPHQIGSIPLMLESLRGLPISDEAKEGILGGNARRLLRL